MPIFPIPLAYQSAGTREERLKPLTLQRHFRVLTKFAHVESRLSGRKRQRGSGVLRPRKPLR
jgi:hypothetical protein